MKPSLKSIFNLRAHQSRRPWSYPHTYRYQLSTTHIPIRHSSNISSPPKFIPALVIRTSPSYRLEIAEVPVPTPGSHQALVQISHAAQNPTDVNSFDVKAFGDGAILGCDFVGEVEAIGKEVTRIQPGDIISGLVWGGETKGLGAFSKYSLADDRLCFRVPPNLTREQASTVPLTCTTAWLALFSKECLHLNRSAPSSSPILIWGGSSSVGLYAIQIAAHHGFEVITACNREQFDLVKSLGARHVFDYLDPNIVTKIKNVAPTLCHAFDTIGAPNTSTIASQALAADYNGNKFLSTVRPGKMHTENVVPGTKVSDVLVWRAFPKEHSFRDLYFPVSENSHELARELFEALPKWLEDGTIKPNNPRIFPGGLDAVQEGFAANREGKISGFKIVYEI